MFFNALFLDTLKGRLPDLLFRAHITEACAMSPKAQADIAQSVAGGQLPEKQLDDLVPQVQAPDTVVAVVTGDTFTVHVAVHEQKDLGENIFS